MEKLNNLKNMVYLLEQLDDNTGAILDDKEADELIRAGIEEYNSVMESTQVKEQGRKKQLKDISKIAEESRII